MKAYKYYVHGKPKTFDLTVLTDDEIEKFKNMDNTERLRFIELHHLENKPLWDTVDIKTSTKLTDEGLTNEKNYKKYYDLYKNQNIKNKLEQMKKDGKTGEVNENDLKNAFSDEDYKDVDDKVKKGYKDYDSLINYYANKIETLNVDSIDTLKAKEIQNLEAKNIAKINISGLNKLVDDYTTVKEGTDEDKEEISKSKELVDKLKEETKKVFPTITKEEIKEIIKDNDLLNAFIEELNDKIKIANKVNDNTEVLKALTDLKNKTISKDEFTKILKDNVKDEEMVKQILKDVGELKGMLEDVKKDIVNANAFLNNVEKVEMKVKEIDLKQLLDKYVKPLVESFVRDFNVKSEVGQSKLKAEEQKELDELKETLEDIKDNSIYELYDYLYSKLIIPDKKNYKYIELKDNLRVLGDLFTKIKTEYNIKGKFADVLGKEEGKGESSYEAMGQSPCGGKFLNRFKDYEPDIKRLERMINEKHTELKDELKDDIKNIYLELKELKQIKTEPKNERVSEQKDFKPSFLNDISKPKNLKPTETKIYEPEEEHKDLKDILRRRREDIEPDETDEDDDIDWGEGIKHSKVIKFKELLKMLK